MEKLEAIGTFTNESGKLRVSDPCYVKETWCAGVLDAKPGQYRAFSVRCQQEPGYISRLLVCHEDHLAPLPGSSLWKLQDIDVGVDSGQAGVFDERYYRDDTTVSDSDRSPDGYTICEDEPWYSICCDRTLSIDKAGVIPFGAVSSAGYGDGSYSCFAVKKNDEVIAVMIEFIPEEDCEDYDY